jgi:hypothetical protein
VLLKESVDFVLVWILEKSMDIWWRTTQMLLSLFVKKLMRFEAKNDISGQHQDQHLLVLEFSLKVVLVLILSLKQAVMLRMIFLNNIKTDTHEMYD